MTTEGPTAGPQGPEPNGNPAKPFYTRWWFIAIAIVIVLGIIGSLGGEQADEIPTASESTTTSATAASTTSSTAREASTTTDAPTTTTTSQPTTTTTPAPNTTTTTLQPGPEPAFGAGVYVIGEDVAPGIYETDLLGDGVFDSCYWERLAGFSGDFEDIIANNNVVVHDVVEIAESDAGFDSGCDAWYELTPLDEPLASIPQGKWVVDVHIQAGTYQSDGGDTCYWERLSGVGGEFDDIIANDLPSGSAIVEIASSDYAFSSTGCGEWTLRG